MKATLTLYQTTVTVLAAVLWILPSIVSALVVNGHRENTMTLISPRNEKKMFDFHWTGEGQVQEVFRFTIDRPSKIELVHQEDENLVFIVYDNGQLLGETTAYNMNNAISDHDEYSSHQEEEEKAVFDMGVGEHEITIHVVYNRDMEENGQESRHDGNSETAAIRLIPDVEEEQQQQQEKKEHFIKRRLSSNRHKYRKSSYKHRGASKYRNTNEDEWVDGNDHLDGLKPSNIQWTWDDMVARRDHPLYGHPVDIDHTTTSTAVVTVQEYYTVYPWDN